MRTDPTTRAVPLDEDTVLAGRYRLGARLARGGTADVYQAHDAQLDRPVAVKRFRAAEPTARERFEAEAQLLASLSHPNLVAVYDAGEHHDAPYIVLELVTGPTLRELVAEHGPQPPALVARLGADLAGALAHIHARGVVHRDLTPTNVLCGADGAPRLTDFGIARLVDTARVTAEHLTVGTAGYMSPEQVRGEEVTAASDVYSLGLVLLEALTGTPAFRGRSHEVAVARLSRDPSVPDDLPEPWPALLRSMTASAPADRPEPAAVATALRPEAAPRSLSMPALGGPVVGRRRPAAVVTTDPAADLDGATAAMPLSPADLPPTHPSGPGTTAVMPKALVPGVGGPAPGDLEAEPTGSGRAGPPEALAATLGGWAGGLRDRARQLSALQRLAAAVAVIALLAAWQSSRSSWYDQVDAARAAAAGPAAPTTTAASPTTTTASPPTEPVVVAPDEDDRPAERPGKGDGGPGKGKGGDEGPDKGPGKGKGKGRG